MRKGVSSGEGSEEGHAGPEEVRAQLLLPLCCKLGEQKGGAGRKNDPFTELMDVSCWGLSDASPTLSLTYRCQGEGEE